ncbi:MAG TPA: putative toxin-antitoxin system toxin component, PIN family, partial [Tepidisphaeraceae bacterium]|nr:putative toxin-antitoxin system toxin component, PIN family [Tepidisphaeraceae bacterium]
MTRLPGRIRAVFDCNVFVQALAFEGGPAAHCLGLVESGGIELFISKPVLAELRRVFGYQEVLAISSNMTSPRIAAFLKRLAYRGTMIRRVRHRFRFERDRQDEPYIDLAIEVKADFLVTRDSDLHSLATGHAAECKRFRQLSRPLEIVDPCDFMARIKSATIDPPSR